MQGELFDDIPELRFWTKVVASSKKIAKERLPRPEKGQSLEDYQEELKDETTLEIAFMLRKIADYLEDKALKRQNLNIQLNFEARNEVNT
ncbi:MAG: hypothetical protein IJI42_02715 [Methanobrevibacter sp.]|nr:hypothetical protein [Methanobrevibacter sp.]